MILYNKIKTYLLRNNYNKTSMRMLKLKKINQEDLEVNHQLELEKLIRINFLILNHQKEPSFINNNLILIEIELLKFNHNQKSQVDYHI